MIYDEFMSSSLSIFIEKKEQNLRLACLYDQFNSSKAFRLKQCALTTKFDGLKRDELAWYIPGHASAPTAAMCKLRFCAICSWRRARNIYHQVLQKLKNPSTNGFQFALINLTVLPCKGEELPKALDLEFKAFKKLMAKKINLINQPAPLNPFSNILGTFSHLKVVYFGDNLYQPCFHVMVCTDKTNPDFLSPQILHNVWSETCERVADKRNQISAVPAVSTRILKNKFDAAVEASAYQVDIEKIQSSNVLKILDEALAGRRSIQTSGIFDKASGERDEKK